MGKRIVGETNIDPQVQAVRKTYKFIPRALETDSDTRGNRKDRRADVIALPATTAIINVYQLHNKTLAGFPGRGKKTALKKGKPTMTRGNETYQDEEIYIPDEQKQSSDIQKAIDFEKVRATKAQAEADERARSFTSPEARLKTRVSGFSLIKDQSKFKSEHKEYRELVLKNNIELINKYVDRLSKAYDLSADDSPIKIVKKKGYPEYVYVKMSEVSPLQTRRSIKKKPITKRKIVKKVVRKGGKR